MFVAFSAPDAGTIAEATTDWPSAEKVRAKLIQCAAVTCPLSLGVLAERSLIIERIASDQSTVLASATYAIPHVAGQDRALTFEIDVAIFTGAAVRARFDQCAGGETQWVVINYDYQR